jgi:acylphosphatase
MKRVSVLIRGYVQGVGFRASCQREAVSLGLTGWVRNRWDGSVEALLEGPEEAVDQMIEWCRQGPPRAEVSSVEVTPAPEAEPLRSFNVRVL